ncbi:MAG: rhodanese-like domain-containing protein [Verrucomicrobia bacterium]|nr:rhodanese-like domain-containing protein [Verrucomicrobiota bacterium]
MGPTGGRKNAIVDSEFNARDRVREILPRELARLKEYPLFVDVREESEFLYGHIEGARNVSPSVLGQVVPEISPDHARPIVVYCARGTTSAVAAKLLQKLGYQNVYSLKDGLFGWLEAGGVLQTCKRR